MPLGDTIAAIATPHGRSARAILRISGPATNALLGALMQSDSPPQGPHPVAFTARFVLALSLSLPVLIIRAFAPRSYTGEDTAEILFPGNPYLAERLLDRIVKSEDVRLAAPGEFTARAYLNEKLTLDQAEGVAATIAAENENQLAAAQQLLAGETGNLYHQWLEEMATLLALVEAGIDFTDQEDVIPIAPRDLHARLTRLDAALESHLGAAAGAEAASSLPRIVIAGRPSTGKSTLFNALLGRLRAVVSPEPGTTRDALEETLDLSREIPGGCPVQLIDIAGLDQSLAAPGTLDQQAQQRARDVIADADVIIHCDPGGRYDLPLPESTSTPTIRVRTKADLPVAQGGADSAPAASEAIAICALDGWNLPVLRRAIADAATGARAAGIASLLPRHRRELASARGSIAGALGSIDPASSHIAEPELTAGALRASLDALGELAGRVSPDDVIGRIFATFCVGK